MQTSRVGLANLRQQAASTQSFVYPTSNVLQRMMPVQQMPVRMYTQPNQTPARAVVQMMKYVYRKPAGKIHAVPDNHDKKKGKEIWKSAEEFLENPAADEASKGEVTRLLELKRVQEVEKQRQLRIQQREQRKLRMLQEQGPKVGDYKQKNFPKVAIKDAEGLKEDKDLIFRGMSINNVKNLRQEKGVVFNAQKPGGTATPDQHIVEDSSESPYLSFETEGLDISSGKYAAKPVDPLTRKPFGVEKKEGGFLKQKKSYEADSRTDFPDALRIGYVGGIKKSVRPTLDYSTQTKAAALKTTKAQDLAIADREILVKPGNPGIPREDVPFVARVKEVDYAYYKKHIVNQTPRKALGFYKSSKGDPIYHKIQIPDKYTHASYEFQVPKDTLRNSDDEGPEMSDVESIGFSDDDE